MAYRKSILIILISILIVFSLTGCKNKKELNRQVIESPVKYEEIQLIDPKIIVNENNNNKLEATFRNNSKKTISNIQFIYDINGRHYYLRSSDVLAPGQSSGVKHTFIGSNTNIGDLKLLSTTIAIEEDDKHTAIIYDTDLREYIINDYTK